MTELDLFESIGNVNDQAVEMAQKPLRSRRRLIIEISSLAACAMFACAAVMLLGNMNQNNSALVSGDGSGIVPAVSENSTVSENSQVSENAPVQEDSSDSALEQITLNVYYIREGKLEQKTVTADASPEIVFDLWKQENHIGGEVRFISAKIDDNGTVEYSELDGMETATYTVGDYFIYTLTVSKELEQYYDSIGKELLLESLKKTMTGMYEMEFDEYHFVLSDGTENSGTGSSTADPDAAAYDDQDRILE